LLAQAEHPPFIQGLQSTYCEDWELERELVREDWELDLELPEVELAEREEPEL
jgi:hypothetical protein